MSKERILWADDEIDLLKPHILFLEDKGYEVETVTNGRDALDMLGNQIFNLIILDENMPGISGLEALQRIKAATAQFTGVKIGVMGCIVNGPGEMADADYGYVGSGPGKITLYKGKEIVKRNIDEKDAVEELVKLISDDKK